MFGAVSLWFVHLLLGVSSFALVLSSRAAPPISIMAAVEEAAAPVGQPTSKQRLGVAVIGAKPRQIEERCQACFAKITMRICCDKIMQYPSRILQKSPQGKSTIFPALERKWFGSPLQQKVAQKFQISLR